MKKNKNAKQKENSSRCKYKMLFYIDNTDALQSYNEYMQRFYPQLKVEPKVQGLKIEENIEQSTNIVENNTTQNNLKNNQLEDYDELIQQFLKYSQSNVYKNIIYAFQKHISELKDEKLQQIYEKLTPDKWKFSYIQLRAYQNFKNCGRFNLKMKNLIKSKNLNKIFSFFLQNAENLWMNGSKLKDKSQHLDAIQILMQIQQNPEIVKNIDNYKKSKKSEK
ncbi:hypothetical protein TTHERM_000537028 (macronuclear) [Tetrahymena thermophila SB210]|uniref:Uncharacterized protein n=1 Tax=Tetrahymena thermophila (strain SB210) TaxID=312017 RepID=W7WZ99_TETTS|nr:hypothetical protein TTHERM_000537028 [Tetrahymena thermophila SB210]EWS72215.1 hypothetical protein TTHERM_000537028 [Tetrahymena thermophila SB210]|eukprot:XP_012655258.1 hypothetical protein TTHERM_000537028 [Tetrahymena thermophila SB210]